MVQVSEAGVMFAEVEMLEEAIGLIDGGDLGAAEGLDEAILVGAVGPFDTSLCLWRTGVDKPDAEPGEGPSNVGQAPGLGAVDGAKIDAKLAWNAVSLHIGLEHSQHVVGVLRLGKTHEDRS